MSHRCHRLRAQNVILHAHAIVFTVSPRGKFPPLPLFDHRRVGILSWHIVCCCNKSELKLIITLSSYHIICCSNPIVAIAVYRPYHQMASSVSTMAYHPHHIVGGLGGYWRRCISHLTSPIHLIYPQWYGDETIRLPLVSSGPTGRWFDSEWWCIIHYHTGAPIIFVCGLTNDQYPARTLK